MKLPRAIQFDLDDTILVAFGPAQSQWQRTIAAFADQLGQTDATVIAAAIKVGLDRTDDKPPSGDRSLTLHTPGWTW